MPKLVTANDPVAKHRRVVFDVRLSSDGISPALGEAGEQPLISLDGETWTSDGIGVLVEMGNGSYYADLDVEVIETPGTIIETRYKGTLTPWTPGDTFQVVSYRITNPEPGEPIVIGAPAAPDLCRVYGFESLDGTAVENRTVRSSLAHVPQTTVAHILENSYRTTQTDEDGFWYFDLVIAKHYRITIPEAGVNKVFTVPDQEQFDFRTLL